ncbi:MAG TPA: cytochrome C oxidase subunit IV family protein [Bacteroidota bacterium]|jgi:cytochrome c oxidase subunit 4|nr:cytochrome C oxidase subunit IV family protein [Bacteroidota bacterium]
MAHHVVPQKIYVLIFATLICLTLLTVDVSFYNMGFLNIYVAMTIATCKALFVVLYFMHVRYSPKLTWIFAGAAIFWLIIMFSLLASDYLTR